MWRRAVVPVETLERCSRQVLLELLSLDEGIEERERDVAIGLGPSASQIVHHQPVNRRVAAYTGDHRLPAITDSGNAQTVTLLNRLAQRRALLFLLQRALQPDLGVTELAIHIDDGPLGARPVYEAVIDRMQRQIVFRAAGHSAAGHLEAPLHREGHPVVDVESMKSQSQPDLPVVPAELLLPRSGILEQRTLPRGSRRAREYQFEVLKPPQRAAVEQSRWRASQRGRTSWLSFQGKTDVEVLRTERPEGVVLLIARVLG